MSGFDFDDIIIGQPQSHAQPQPAALAPVKTINIPTRPPADSEIWPQYAEPIKPPERNGVHPAWAALLAFLAVTFFVLWLSTFRFAPGPGPDPNVDPVDGAYVAIFYDDKEKGTYTPSQVAAMDSAAVAQFLDDSVTGWKKIDVDQIAELNNLNPVYAEMADVHRAKLPWVVVRAGRKLGSEPVSTPDELLDLVKRTVK